MKDLKYEDMSRYLFAIVLAMGILFAWQILFPPEQREVNSDSTIEQNNIIQSNIINDEIINSSEPCREKESQF